jgi:hypothetical protein
MRPVRFLLTAALLTVCSVASAREPRHYHSTPSVDASTTYYPGGGYYRHTTSHTIYGDTTTNYTNLPPLYAYPVYGYAYPSYSYVPTYSYYWWSAW